MKLAALLIGSIASFAKTASAQVFATGLPCTGDECLIISVTFCGDPHFKDKHGKWYNVDGECEDLLLMDNQDYDEYGNSFQILSDVSKKNGVSIVSTTTLKVGPDSLTVYDDHTFSINEEDGLSAQSNTDNLGGNKLVIQEGTIAEKAESGRALSYSVTYVIFYIYCGQGVIIVISTKFDVLCITIVGPKFRLDLLIGLFGHSGHYLPEVPEGCTIEYTSAARLRKRARGLTAIDAEAYNGACAGVEADEQKICAFGAAANDLEAKKAAGIMA